MSVYNACSKLEEKYISDVLVGPHVQVISPEDDVFLEISYKYQTKKCEVPEMAILSIMHVNHHALCA